MKKIVFVLIFFMVVINSFAERTIIFALEESENYPYYTGYGKTLNCDKPGVSIELLKIVEEELGIDIEFRREPWKRVIDDLEKGKIDGAFNASFKQERTKMGVYPKKDGNVDESKRITTLSYCLYKRRDSDLDWNGEEFINLKGALGAPLGYSVVSDLEKMGVKVETSKSTFTDMKKLKYRRIEGVAALEQDADMVIKNNKEYQDIVKVSPPIVTKAYYLILSHQFAATNPILAQKIWDKIEEVREKKLNELLEKYISN